MSTQTQTPVLDHPVVFTRDEYVRDRTVSHDDYYAQFVTEQALRKVESWFGVEQLSQALAEDRHLNTIPLRQWDALSIQEIDQPRGWSPSPSGRFYAAIELDREAIAVAGETVTRSTLVCVAKRAAQMLVERRAQLLAATV